SGFGEGAEIERLSRTLARRPFDIAAGPLVRFAEIVQGKTRARLVAIFHHLICDGAALDLFLGELFAAYAALAGGSAPVLPPVEIQLADVARWQAANLTPERTAEPLAHFRSRLADLEPLDLPSDRPRGARRSGRGKTVAARFGGDLQVRLAARARAAGATPFMLWVAALQALLARISGRAKTAIGTPIANRRSPELERMFGFVANTLVLDAEMGDDPAAAGLIDRVRAGALAAYAREDLPFELLVEALAPRRDLAQNPLFDVLISLEPPLGARHAGALDLTPVRLDTGTAKLDLSLAVVPAASGFEVWAEHDAELFDSTTIARWLAGYERLLGALADGANDRVSALPLLAAEEVRQLLTWSGEKKSLNEGELLHARFFSQAERIPNAPAVVAAEETWTYGELAARALAIAGSLAARGVAPEERVGVLLSRGPELIAALFGVLAAGGAYVPLDPAYPEERLRFLLEDSGARICLTEQGLASLVPEDAVVLLSDLTEGKKSAACVAPTPRHLAYLIYTSGSTGRPKSVAIEHGTAAGFVTWALSSFPPPELLSVLFSTSVCFDLSIFELFAPLSSGGALVLAENALDLPRAATRHPVTLINTVPSALAELVRSEGLPPSVVTVNLAGEALPGALVERIFASSPNVARVNNLYGPSEDTTYSTWGQSRRGETSPAPPIGRPLPGTHGYVVGRRGELSIPGVPGELRLGGLGLARGYLGRPDLTAERFVPDPFSGVPGARLYATGDRVRWIEIDADRPALEYLGRIDHQVKVRGFRVELGEVESALAACGDVREAAAAIVGDGAERRLVGFFAGEVDAAAVLADLRSRLPGYLVPSTLTVLDALPRLPNGKIDRRALPALAEGTANSADYVAPRNETETRLAEVFAEVLGRERVGAFDDFFALGGHSLLAARAVARIGRAFGGRDLALSLLFEAPTVAGLSEKLSKEGGTVVLPPIGVADRSEEGLPLAFAQERVWFLEQLAPGRPTYHLAGAVEIAGRFDSQARARFAAALAQVVARHEILRTAVLVRGAGPRQVVLSPLAEFFLPLADLAAIPGRLRAAESERLARSFGSLPFDLARGQTLRAAVLRSSSAANRLAVSLHHAAADGASLGLLIGEVAEIYAALSDDRAPVLPSLPIQFADFSVWQRAALDGDALKPQLEAWRARLAGLPVLDLPTDRKRPAVRSGRGAILERPISSALLARLDARARAAGASRFQALAAMALGILARLTGETRIPVGTPVANRPRVELEPLIGMFVNTLVLDVETGDDPAAGALLARTRASAIAALALRELPFERLVEALAPRRDTAQNPLFQVLFVLEEPLAPFAAGDLRLAPRRLDVGATHFDLTLEAMPAGDGLTLAAEYDTDLFDAGTIDRWLGGYERLLAALADEPERHLSDLPLLAPEEISQLSTWSAGEQSVGEEGLLHARFFGQAERTPNAPAVFGADETWSYGRLAGRALAISAALAARGIAPEDRVGVLLSRGPDLVAAILGVLAAGGVYVPLDPTYPEERLRFLLEDSGARICIAERGLEALVPGVSVVLLQDLADGKEGAASSAPTTGDGETSTGEGLGRRGAACCALSPRHLAYLIYTSGSTGRPKSVAIEHGTAAGFISWALAAFPPDELAAVLFSTSVCFDLSIFELFAPLSSGGALVLAENALDLPVVAGRHPVTLINTVPSALAELVRSEGLPPSVVTVNLAGEALPGELVERIFASSPNVRTVNNLYGPSEDTTYSTHARIVRSESGTPRAEAPPIGRPLPGTQGHVVGRWGERVPQGVPGELRLGGSGLARGYLGRPDLTAERFVPDPFSGEPGTRLYATGDRVRWIAGPTPELAYLGRIDNQVKVRGFRV
ncbi:MAG TPA: amino acid adenylation domain-containing protein, partial [Thermoanaerobaculia bacterium]|nr:amino acid adenylation domain-containing protein [Thermoanaerobaculia bacterium]